MGISKQCSGEKPWMLNSKNTMEIKVIYNEQEKTPKKWSWLSAYYKQDTTDKQSIKPNNRAKNIKTGMNFAPNKRNFFSNVRK